MQNSNEALSEQDKKNPAAGDGLQDKGVETKGLFDQIISELMPELHEARDSFNNRFNEIKTKYHARISFGVEDNQIKGFNIDYDSVMTEGQENPAAYEGARDAGGRKYNNYTMPLVLEYISVNSKRIIEIAGFSLEIAEEMAFRNIEAGWDDFIASRESHPSV